MPCTAGVRCIDKFVWGGGGGGVVMGLFVDFFAPKNYNNQYKKI